MQIRKYEYEFLDESRQKPQAVKNDNKLEPIPEPVIIDNTPKAIYTEEEMKLAKAIAKEEGIKEGGEILRAQFLDAEAKKSQTLQEIAEKIEQQILATQTEVEQKIMALGGELKLLALAVAKKATGQEANAAMIENYIKDYLARLTSKDKIKVILHPQNADIMAVKFKNIEITRDENLGHGDFRLEWDGGYGERKLNEIWQEIENILRKS